MNNSVTTDELEDSELRILQTIWHLESALEKQHDMTRDELIYFKDCLFDLREKIFLIEKKITDR